MHEEEKQLRDLYKGIHYDPSTAAHRHAYPL